MPNRYINTSHYVSGQWNVICDVCGFKFKSGQIRKRWDGLMVCSKDYETDHPQKYLRVRETGLAVPYVREENEVFEQVCYIYATAAYAGLAEAGCAQAGLATPSYAILYNLKYAGTP